MTEREFIHALANQMAIASGMLDALNHIIKKGDVEEEKLDKYYGKIKKAHEKITVLLKERSDQVKKAIS